MKRIRWRDCETVQEIISDDELFEAFKNTNFGTLDFRYIIAIATLKCLSGYAQGYTSKYVSTKLGLISPTYKVTAKGRQYLYLHYSKGDKF